MKPLPGGSVDDERLIQGAGEEQGCEPEGPGSVDEADGPVAHEMQGVGDGDGGVGREQVQRHEGADGRRQRDDKDARADRLGCIPGAGWRGPCGRREVEWDDIDEAVDDLYFNGSDDASQHYMRRKM